MKLQQILLKEVVFDPKSRGPENQRSFYSVKDGYDLEWFEDRGAVKVAHTNRHCWVAIANAKEWRELAAEEPVLVPAAPKFEMVKTAEGAFVMKPVAKLVTTVSENEVGTHEEPVIPPRKRGRPRKAA